MPQRVVSGLSPSSKLIPSSTLQPVEQLDLANTRLSLGLVAAWLQTSLQEQTTTKILVASARQPDMPDRCVTVMRNGSGKDVMNGDFEEIPIRLQSRGRSESLEDAESLALLVDDIMFDIQNMMMGQVYVTTCRVVYKPKLVPITDKQSRYQFTGDYLLTASRYN